MLGPSWLFTNHNYFSCILFVTPFLHEPSNLHIRFTKKKHNSDALCCLYEQSSGNKNETAEKSQQKHTIVQCFYKLEKKITFARNRTLLTPNGQPSGTPPLSANEDAGKRPGAWWSPSSRIFYPAELRIWPAYRDGTERAWTFNSAADLHNPVRFG